jgi:hypothetical protein
MMNTGLKLILLAWTLLALIANLYYGLRYFSISPRKPLPVFWRVIGGFFALLTIGLIITHRMYGVFHESILMICIAAMCSASAAGYYRITAHRKDA